MNLDGAFSFSSDEGGVVVSRTMDKLNNAMSADASSHVDDRRARKSATEMTANHGSIAC